MSDTLVLSADYKTQKWWSHDAYLHFHKIYCLTSDDMLWMQNLLLESFAKPLLHGNHKCFNCSLSINLCFTSPMTAWICDSSLVRSLVPGRCFSTLPYCISSIFDAVTRVTLSLSTGNATILSILWHFLANNWHNWHYYFVLMGFASWLLILLALVPAVRASHIIVWEPSIKYLQHYYLTACTPLNYMWPNWLICWNYEKYVGTPV